MSARDSFDDSVLDQAVDLGGRAKNAVDVRKFHASEKESGVLVTTVLHTRSELDALDKQKSGELLKGKTDTMHGGSELHFHRRMGEDSYPVLLYPRVLRKDDTNICKNTRKKQLNYGRVFAKSDLYFHVPLKKVPVRVAKYDVRLREAPLRAAQAMHAILTNMGLFECHDCKERFPTFHPSYVPPPCIADDMEILKRRGDGVAACSVEVFKWDELPPFLPPLLPESSTGLAFCAAGTCLRCQKDIDKEARDLKKSAIIALRSEENHMDPCFRFPADDLRDLFAHATITESMLVALEHMQVNFVQISKSGLRKFRRNTISFPQDIAGFAQRLHLMKGFQLRDRVNSTRGPGVGADRENPDREERKAVHATDEEIQRHGVDKDGALLFPASVKERLPNGSLVLVYDHGGEGIEKPENVTARMQMPWHPKNVPLHIMLRRNVGRGKDTLEGLHVRWHYIANLLQALCAFPRNGYGPWRLEPMHKYYAHAEGSEMEPMHKYYDPRHFDRRERFESASGSERV